MEYRIYIDDNFHFTNEDERIDGPVCQTKEEALSEARRIVDDSLRHILSQSKKPLGSGELFDHYQTFGDDPFIRSDDPTCSFSAWGYAEARCRFFTSRAAVHAMKDRE